PRRARRRAGVRASRAGRGPAGAPRRDRPGAPAHLGAPLLQRGAEVLAHTGADLGGRGDEVVVTRLLLQRDAELLRGLVAVLRIPRERPEEDGVEPLVRPWHQAGERRHHGGDHLLERLQLALPAEELLPREGL